MKKDFDIVIAGAGVAGCLLARNLARQGHSVALLERKRRDNLGHDWWDNVSFDVFREVGMPPPEPPEAMEPIGDSVVLSPSGSSSFPVTARTDKRNIDRRLFGARLLQYAEEAGVSFFERTVVVAPLLDGATTVGLVVRKENSDEIRIHARITVDATGVDAVLRRKSSEEHGFQREIDPSERFVAYREIRQQEGEDLSNLLIFGRHNGVQWTLRSQAPLVDFFAGVVDLPGRPDPRTLVQEMVRTAGDAGSRVARAGYGAFLPVRRGFDSFVAPGLILCGDAACQSNPINGCGIASSLRAAQQASETLHTCLKSGRVDVEALWPYNAAYQRTQGVLFARLHALQRFLLSEHTRALEWIMRRGIIHPSEVFGREDHDVGTIKLGQALRLVKLADHPGLLLRLIRIGLLTRRIAQHYECFPTSYSPNGFDAWRERTQRLFGRIPPPCDSKALN